jgi:hypothetical protein
MDSKLFIKDRRSILDFLDKYATEYNLDDISRTQSIKLYNNIEFNGRVANFIVDINDINYYIDILKILNLWDDVYEPITFDYLMENVIETLIQWIQLRLNTSKIYLHKYWNFLNKLYIQKCFDKESFNYLYTKGLTDTNIRNIFFGDCREHEILLHVLLKLYLKKHNLLSNFKLFRYYGYGTTITNIRKNNLFWRKSKSLSQNRDIKISLSKGGNSSKSSSSSSSRDSSQSMTFNIFPKIDDLSILTWEHTHPLLYDISSNKLYAIDALGHKTHINPNAVERHNVEIMIEKIEQSSSYSLWYSNLKDRNTRIYIESPTFFSGNKQWALPYKSKKSSLIYGHEFDDTKLLKSLYYNSKYRILDLRSIPTDLFLEDGVKELCLLFEKK